MTFCFGRYIARSIVFLVGIFILESATKRNGCVIAWVVVPSTSTTAPQKLGALSRNLRYMNPGLQLQSDDSASNNDSSGRDSFVATTSPSETSSKKVALTGIVAQLKRVLEREYITFFNPMECDYYRNDVTFIDPLTSLSGIGAYENNVNMLSGRTLLGSILFRDARIILHTITGGAVIESDDDFEIEKIITRWTLKFTFQILPWQPSPSFSGISVYTLTPGGTKGVQIIQQNDFWDSINLQPGGSYQPVSNSIAIQHFISLLLPSNFQAKSAGPELPYTTLRLKGSEYEIRRYPSYTGIQMIYDRRDEAFIAMGSYTTGMNPMAPAMIQVNATDPTNVVKTMIWPIQYVEPGEPMKGKEILQNLLPKDAPTDIVSVIAVPERVVAVRTFNDMIVEPLVRKVDQALRQCLHRDGLLSSSSKNNNEKGDTILTSTATTHNAASIAELLTFAQYDAIYSMGERRCEVHIPLPDGTHPW